MNSIIPVRAFKDNYIWLIIDTEIKTAIAVDPGDANPVLEYLHEHQLQLTGILVTHHHADHSGGVKKLLQQWPSIPVYGFSSAKVPGITHQVKEDDIINIDSFQCRVLFIPGHTLDHVSYYNDEYVFCGDTLFSAGCGRVFEGTHTKCINHS